jgi:hypothetical protein
MLMVAWTLVRSIIRKKLARFAYFADSRYSENGLCLSITAKLYIKKLGFYFKYMHNLVKT